MSTRTASASPTRSSPTTSRRRRSSSGTRRSRSIRTSSSSRSGTSAARTIRRATSMAASSCRRASTTSHVIKGKTWEALAASIKKRLKQYAAETGDLKLAPDFAKNLEGDGHALQRLRAEGQGRRLPSRRAAGRAALQRPDRGEDRQEPDHVSDQRRRPVLRGADDRRQSRHQGRPGDQRQRPGARRARRADPRPLRRRQLRRLGLGPRLLGGRRDARPVPGLRLSRGERRRPRARASSGQEARSARHAPPANQSGQGRNQDGTDQRRR